MARHNGWTNYETWLFRCWIDNDEGNARFWGETARRCYRDATAEPHFTRKENAAFALRDIFKEHLDDSIEAAVAGGTSGVAAGFVTDLLRGAASEVNVMEVAKSWIESYADED